MKKLLPFFWLLCLRLYAQETFPVNGVYNKNNTLYAFTHVTLYTDYQTRITDATLLVRHGVVEKAGTGIAIPKGAVIYDLTGKFIYPSFIESYSSYGIPDAKAPPAQNPQMESNTKGAFCWNQAVKPETDAGKLFTADAGAASEMRKMGFGAALVLQRDGIVRGTSAMVSLGEGKENNLLIATNVSANYSFDKGVSTQDYPSSQMGSIALLRQTYLDAKWYASDNSRREKNLSLEAFITQQKLPQVFDVNDKFSALRADKVGDEFGVQYIIKGSGDEYQRIAEIKDTKATFLLPLNFPMAYDVSDPYDAMLVSLGEMKHWEMAPGNPAAFEKAQIQFALTSSDLKDKNDFRKNVLKAIEYGLSPTSALKALTYTPATILGMGNKLGSLKEGMIANFLITSDTLFSEKCILYQNWVQGVAYEVNPSDIVDLRGNYDLHVGNRNYPLSIGGEVGAYQPNLKMDSVKTPVKLSVSGNSVSLSFDIPSGNIRLSGSLPENANAGFKGRGQLEDGAWTNWNAVYTGAFKKEEKKDSLQKIKPETGTLFFPNMAYGWTTQPVAENVLFKNAMIWSNEKGGIFTGDVLIQNGKIVSVGKVNVVPAGIKTIDLTGKHLTSGIIDEHSHIAISNGVNEGAQASSAEVRIGDVVTSDDINIYRQLSGGVTASQLLHGSANPIGGQSAIIKLRWGLAPEKMKIEGADGFIKFALGENVKQSNWGDRNVIRFPQTRMGVEQVYYDAFQRAKEYEAQWKKFNSQPKEKGIGAVPRKDLELEALVEILNKKRFITCHSYVQSEINMLMHVGDSMGFRVNTFTHILEGYKVADKMKAHGAGASTFSDWWAYKFEVKDAIPYNAALLTQMGVVTAVNSDDAEMARRLNQEAAKAVKYGGLSQEEAWKLCTLNPAKLLHLDKHMGSIAEGKDADLVIWSDNPLSVYASVEKTYVDGILYYDVENDKQKRTEIASERNRLIQKMIASKKEGAPTQKPALKKPKLYHCDDLETGNHEN
jgi:imidazolonepropionase-like amidohydrolase